MWSSRRPLRGRTTTPGLPTWAAKVAAEDDLRIRRLDWTILRPGRLTGRPGSALVTLADPPVTPGDMARDDVADVIAALPDTPEVRRLHARTGRRRSRRGRDPPGVRPRVPSAGSRVDRTYVSLAGLYRFADRHGEADLRAGALTDRPEPPRPVRR
ncbi:NAD(P)H-binding protein [Microbispora siamensis]